MLSTSDPKPITASAFAAVLTDRATIPDTNRARFRMTSRLNATLVAHDIKSGSRLTVAQWDGLLRSTPVSVAGLT
jgi:hypothetical protein